MELAELLRGKGGFAIRPRTIEAALLKLSSGISSRAACAACEVPLGSHQHVAKLAHRIAGLQPPAVPTVVAVQPATKFLDLFTGSGSVTKVALEAGCEVKSLDDCSEGVVSPHGVTFREDILQWDYVTALSDWLPDVIWASPLCTPYSDANCTSGPRRIAQLQHGDALVARTIAIIRFVQTLRAERAQPPLRYVLENPDGTKESALMNRPVIRSWGSPSVVAHYCQYDCDWRKPTRFWVASAQAALDLRTCPGGRQCDVMEFRRKTGRWHHKASPGCGLHMYGVQPRLEEKYPVPSELVRQLCGL